MIFEILNTETLQHAKDKCEKILKYGARRAFLIDANEFTVYEKQEHWVNWLKLDNENSIEDKCFFMPLPVITLLDDDEIEPFIHVINDKKRKPIFDAILLEKQQESKEKGIKIGEEKGKIETLRESIAALCEVLSIDIDANKQADLQSMTREQLQLKMQSLRKDRTW
jgi:predicted transposase YdaD